MTHESLLNELWQTTLTRLGGTAAIEASAREKGAFLRSRAVVCATDLLRLVLAYCLGGMGLRSASAWAASAGLADLSNVALLKRLRKCGAWMEHLAGTLLSAGIQPEAGGRRIRLLDGTTVPKAGKEAKKNSGLWRLHCAFDLPEERFSFIELTDEKGGERLDRTPFAKGDIAIADRGYMHPEPLAHIVEQGADVIVRTKLRIRFGNGPAPATRAANLALRQRLRVEIVLTAIDRRAGEPRDPRHNRETTPSCGPHLGSCEQSPASLVELAADRVPAILNAALVDHATGIRPFAEIRNPARPSHTDARPQSAIQLLFGMS